MDAKKMLKLARSLRGKGFLHNDHPIPMNRRQMLQQGFLSATSAAAVPSLFGFFSNRALAVECGKPAAAGLSHVPYLHVELSGGASIAGHVVFGKQRDGAPLELLSAAGYGTLGMPTAIAPQTVAPDVTLGGAHHPQSAFFTGMKSVLSAEALAKVALVGGAGVSADDTANNPHNGVQLAIAVTGSQGQLVQIAGSEGSPTGGRTRALDVGEDSSLSRARIRSGNDAAQLVDAGLLAERLSQADAERIHKAISNLSESKLRALSAKSLPQQYKDLAACGFIGSTDLLSQFDADNLRPDNDEAFQGIDQNGDDARIAAIAKLLLDGNAAAGTIQKGGHDYHGRGRVEANARDFDAGRDVGVALEVAHRKGQPMFIAVTSDGACSARGGGNGQADGFSDWASDSGSRGAYMMIAIGRTQRPELLSTQIGAFNDGGAVDRGYLSTATNARIQALNIVQNYASFSGKSAEFVTKLSEFGVQNPFDGQDKQYLAFAPLSDEAE